MTFRGNVNLIPVNNSGPISIDKDFVPPMVPNKEITEGKDIYILPGKTISNNHTLFEPPKSKKTKRKDDDDGDIRKTKQRKLNTKKFTFYYEKQPFSTEIAPDTSIIDISFVLKNHFFVNGNIEYFYDEDYKRNVIFSPNLEDSVFYIREVTKQNRKEELKTGEVFHDIDSTSSESKENIEISEKEPELKSDEGWKIDGYNPEYVTINRNQIILRERGTSSELLYFYVEKPFENNRVCNLKLLLKGGTFFIGFITQAEKESLNNYQNNPEPTVPQLQSKFKELIDSEIDININMEKKLIEMKLNNQIESVKAVQDILYLTLACEREKGKEKSVTLEYLPDSQRRKGGWWPFW